MKLWIISEVTDGKLEERPSVYTFAYQAQREWQAYSSVPFDPSEQRSLAQTARSTVYLDVVEVPGRVEIPDEVVQDILNRYHSDERPSTTALGREYGIAQTMVSAIVRGSRRRDTGVGPYGTP